MPKLLKFIKIQTSTANRGHGLFSAPYKIGQSRLTVDRCQKTPCARRFVSSLGLSAILACSPAIAQESEPSEGLLPTIQQQEEFGQFASDAPHIPHRSGEAAQAFGTTFFGKSVPRENYGLDSFFATSDTEVLERPVSALGQINLQFSALATTDEIMSILEENQLAIVDVDQRIGMWTVSALAATDFIENYTTPRANELDEDGLGNIIEDLRRNSLVVAAARNPYLTPNIFKDLVNAEPQAPVFGVASEVIDWGIQDANIDDVWPLATSEIRVGVIDVGFADHEDIAFEDGLPHDAPINNHGNHVAGIACGLHNSIGIKGTVPNCIVVRGTGNFVLDLFEPVEGQGTEGWNALFSEIVGTVLDFIDNNEDVKVLNLSLGYNWLPNFAENPEEIENAHLRNEVRELGRMHASILAFAKKRGVVIVSAAGNDSSTLPSRLDSRWASPFNFGSKLVEELDGWSNGIIVEAHDASNDIALFSNAGGHISAPGVDVLSALADAPNSYGKLSGTSMASPYVAGVVALLQSRFQNLSSRDIMDCLLSSNAKTNFGSVKLDANNAVQTCDAS